MLPNYNTRLNGNRKGELQISAMLAQLLLGQAVLRCYTLTVFTII